MVKKIWGSLIIMILSVNFLHAGVAGQSSDDNRQFGKAFLDFIVNDNSYEEYAYMKRGGISFSKSFDTIRKGSEGSNIKFTIAAKIAVPNSFHGKKVLIQIVGNSTGYYYNTFINEKKLKGTSTSSIISTDNFGNKFVNLLIKGDKDANSSFVSEIYTNLKQFSIKIASTKKKRGQDYQWHDAKIYVTE